MEDTTGKPGALENNLKMVRDVGATMLVVSPLFVAFKAMWVSQFNLEIASALVSSLDISKYIQVIAIYSLSPLLLMIGGVLAYSQGQEYRRRGPLGRLAQAVVLGVFVTAAMAAPLLPNRILQSSGFAVAGALVIMAGIGGVFAAVARQAWSGAKSIFFLELACVATGLGLLSSDYESSQPASIFLPFAFLVGVLNQSSQPAARMMRSAIASLGCILVFGSALGAGLWISPEVVRLDGNDRTIYVLDRQGDRAVVYVRRDNALLRIDEALIADREFCFYPRQTLLSTLRSVSVGLRECPE